MFKTFGSTRAVFVNQDEGMFVAFPITFDSTVLTLETESRGGRTIVKAGSVVKSGSTVKGITAEEYDITDGPVAGRVVVEGYAWASELTQGALAGAQYLPGIHTMPFNYVSVYLKSYDATAHKAVVGIKNGAKFKTGFSGSDLTITLSASATATYTLNTAADELTITASKACDIEITAIASTGLVGVGTNVEVKGLPIEASV